MECQIVPARRVEINKPKKKTTKQSSNKMGEDLNYVFTLQPIFKPPKSTLDMDTHDDNKSNFSSRKKSLERSKTDAGFNHFTMSRPGTLNFPETLVGHKEINNQTKVSSSFSGMHGKVQVINFNRGPTSTQTTALSSEAKRKSQYRRASSGEELIHKAAASRHHSKNHSTIEISAPGNILGTEGSKSLACSPRPGLVQDPQRRKSAGCKLSSSQTQTKEDTLRRKSLFDSHAVTKWYSQDRRPMSTERGEGGRRHKSNVISPRTLAHLPYSDNIGLEETVTQDQARKMGKLKQYSEWKKQQKPSRQTPKQVWYRTVRSVLAVNQLYHKVQQKARPLQEQAAQKMKA
ncbi:hypothetical protein EGW08_018937 [Elysia chlorotica]|uniref:Uncharacterized protein n=1 Tax=Elysia chlorotica TaxID=188477 RepID=A0A433SVV8_ELYCH|nr:hypothetical protein EGW08_018937 [Elysia chlorotica]